MISGKRLVKWLASLDLVLFVLLFLFLLAMVISLGMANIQTDAIDYYAIVQRLTGDTPPIVSNLPFVEQRSPGYPLLTLPVYYILRLTTFWITPETVQFDPTTYSSFGSRSSEHVLLPQLPLPFRDVFFKDFDLSPQGNWYKWNIIAAMLVTSYSLFFGGLIVSVKTLTLLYSKPVGMSLIPLMLLTSMVFMHNLINTPAYATLTVFGLSCLFAYFWIRSWQTGSAYSQWTAGVFAGLMVLVRLETILVIGVLLVALIIQREFRFLRNLTLGGLLPLALLLFYNTSQFGNPFHAGILQGDMNQIAFSFSYIKDVLASPQSGILFWSTLTLLGIIGLFFTQERPLKALGWATLILVMLIAIRVPIMYFCIGQGTQVVSGISITCPQDVSVMRELIRFDANRYIIPLIPFAVLGLRGLIGRLVASLGNHCVV